MSEKSESSIGCFINTRESFNDIKDEISDEIKQFYSPRIKKQDLTLQALIRCWAKSPTEIKQSIIFQLVKELKVNE